MTGVKRRRLVTVRDCRRYTAYLINAVEGGSIDPAKGTKLGYLVNILLKAIEVSSLEDRVSNLE